MQSTIVKMDAPVREGICSVCQRQREELWFLDTETESLVCDNQCKESMDLAGELYQFLLSDNHNRPNFKHIECRALGGLPQKASKLEEPAHA